MPDLEQARKLIFEGKYADSEPARQRQAPRQTQRPTVLPADRRPVARMPRRSGRERLPSRARPRSGRRPSELHAGRRPLHPRDLLLASGPDPGHARISADKPGQVAFSTTLKTPQKALLKIEATDTLVLNGLGPDYRGIKGALKFECRARVVPRRSPRRQALRGQQRAVVDRGRFSPDLRGPPRPATRAGRTSAATRRPSPAIRSPRPRPPVSTTCSPGT